MSERCGQAPAQVAPDGNWTRASAAQAFALLAEAMSRCLLRPTEALAAELQSGELSAMLENLVDANGDDALARALADVALERRALAAAGLPEARLALEVEYNRLFVGPGHVLAPPYESFFRAACDDGGRGRLRGPAERAVSACYARCGYAMPDPFVDFPDHVAIELELVAMLASEAACAWRDGDVARACSKQDAIDDFCRSHLACWVGPFASAVAAGARRPFYPAIATLASRLVADGVLTPASDDGTERQKIHEMRDRAK